MQREVYVNMLEASSERKRLKGVKLLKKAEGVNPSLVPEGKSERVNLSIHTDYSFSPYSPSLAAYMAYKSGVTLVGISDHDTLLGAAEFKKAADILGIKSSFGFQLRVKVNLGTPVYFNSIYEKDVAFISVRGIPFSRVKAFNGELKSIRLRREKRGREMTARLNNRIKKFGMCIDFERDVLKSSKYSKGGTITERHILFAFAEKIIEKYSSAEEVYNFLTEGLGITVSKDYELFLSDVKNPYFAYDLVDCLKNEVRFFYVPADDAISLDRAVSLAKKYGALVTYNYIGGKRCFGECGFSSCVGDAEGNPNVREVIKALGVAGVNGIECVMPCMTEEKLFEIEKIANENGMFLLPCLDINSPRQRFCGYTEMEQSFETHCLSELMVRNMWAMAGNAYAARVSVSDGLNGERTLKKGTSLEERLKLYAEVGKLKGKNK